MADYGTRTKSFRKVQVSSSTPNPGLETMTSDVNSISYTVGRQGSGVKNHRHLIQNHNNATSAFSGTDFIVDLYLPASATLRYKVGNPPLIQKRSVAGFINQGPGAYSPSSIDSSTINNRALTKFYQAIQEGKSEFNGSNFLGEIRQTIGMVKRPLSALRKHMDGYLKAQLKTVTRGSFRRYKQKEKLRAITGTWLEWRFGFRPLIKDINTLLMEIGKNDGLERYINLHAREMSRVPSADATVSKFTVNALMPFISVVRRFSEVEVIYRGELRVTAGVPGIKGLGSLHFGLEDFVPTLWEVAPLSWLADYFINVGDILQGMTINLSGLAWHNRTIRRTSWMELNDTIDTAQAKLNLGAAFEEYLGTGNTFKYRVTSVSRDVPALGVPAVEFRLPTYPISLTNMLAFTLQQKAILNRVNAAIQ